MEKAKSKLVVAGAFIGLLGIIPAIGFIASISILTNVDSKNARESVPTVSEICDARQTNAQLSQNAAIQSACEEYDNLVLLKQGSIAVLLANLTLPLIYFFICLIGRNRRTSLGIVFPPLVPLTIAILSASVLIQSAILAYSVYMVESYFTGYMHPKLIFVIALVGLIASLNLIHKLITHFKPMSITVAGELLTDKSQKLREIISTVCTKIGAAAPHNVIVGLEPSFYATNCRMQILGKPEKLHGNTLYMSALLLRFFNEEEVKAVIAHEMGHFCGKDTVFTMRFAPVYSSLSKSISSLASNNANEGLGILAKFPYTVSFYKTMV